MKAMIIGVLLSLSIQSMAAGNRVYICSEVTQDGALTTATKVLSLNNDSLTIKYAGGASQKDLFRRDIKEDTESDGQKLTAFSLVAQDGSKRVHLLSSDLNTYGEGSVLVLNKQPNGELVIGGRIRLSCVGFSL